VSVQRRRARCLLVSVVAFGFIASSTPLAPSADAVGPDDGDITDPGLVRAIESAPSASTRLTVEVVTNDTSAARAEVRELAGIVTGSVPGEVLQVSIPVGQIDALAAADSVQTIRKPLIANRPVTGLVEYGPVTGQNVAVTNASAWHAAGITGVGVKVGVVDFFDISLWNPAEHGPLPDAAHRLCIDNSGGGFCPSTGADGEEHGVAVVEIIRDMAPDVELFLATVGTASDLRVAIDWFANNGVTIITRSLGAAYDGPGDGTGPLAAVVDHATARGLTWFNSAGNDAAGAYGRFSEGVDASGYVDFQPGSGVDTTLGILDDPTSFVTCVGFDGIRWSDWNKAASQMTDYAIEVWVGSSLEETIDARQASTGQPIEGQDFYGCALDSSAIEIRIRRVSGGDTSGDIVEVGLFVGDLEHPSVAYSAAKPVVDSRSPGLVAVGAVDPATGPNIGFYSSQGPTNDGRTKPDMSAPSCVNSSIYNSTSTPGIPCFNGTSAASPAAAGMAALLFQRGLAGSGAHLAALTKHMVIDLGAPGPDNVFGSGRATLPPPPPAAIDARPAQFVPLANPTRILDTRAGSATPGARIGPHPQFTILDLPIGIPGATAAAVSIVSVDSVAQGYIQALPKLMGTLAGSSNLNVATSTQIQPNFAIVPIGVDGSITLYLYAGGNVVVDLLGSFTPAATPAVSSGRFVAVDPVRVLDTRPESNGPVPPEFVPHIPAAAETVRVTGIPAGASAAVVNVVADQAQGSGFLRVQPTGATGLSTSNGNFVAGLASGTLSIVPVGSDGTISVYTSQITHIVVDLMGFITNTSAAASSAGLFVPLTPSRSYDSRNAPGGIHQSLSTRLIPMTGSTIPTGASAVSMNLTSDAAAAPGFLTVFPADQPLPTISNLNYPATDPRANAGMVRLPANGTLNTLVNQTTHVIIDVNGYFTGTM
jgi:Subtilase family